MPRITTGSPLQDITKLNSDLTKVKTVLTDDQVLNKLSGNLDKVFKPLTDSDASEKPVYFNGKLSNMSYYSNQQDGYDYAYDKENKKILKYTGKEWEDVGTPKQFDIDFYNKRQEVAKSDFSAKKIESSIKDFDSNNVFTNSPLFGTNELAKAYLRAPQKEVKTIDREYLGKTSAETYIVDGQEYALDKESKAIYKKKKPNAYEYSHSERIDLNDLSVKPMPDVWVKVNDLSDRDMQIARGGIASPVQLLSNTSNWYSTNVVANVTKENATEKIKEAKTKVLGIYNSRDAQTVYNAGKTLTDKGRTDFFDDPINLIKVLGLDKGLNTAPKSEKDANGLQNNINDLVEYLELLKSNGDLHQFKYSDSYNQGESKSQLTYNQLVVEAKRKIVSSDISEDTRSTIPIREGLKDYQQEKFRIATSNARLKDKNTIVKTAQTFEKYAPALKLTGDLKKQYDAAVANKDGVKANKLAEILNKRTQELAKVMPSEEERKTFNEYTSLLQEGAEVYNSIDTNLKLSYPKIYDELNKEKVAQENLQKWNKEHKFLGTINSLVANTLAGLTAGGLGIPSTIAREFSSSKTYDSLDVIADYLDRISGHIHDNVTDKSVESLSWIGAAQSAGYSIGLMAPAIVFSALAPEAAAPIDEALLAGLARTLPSKVLQFGSVFTGIYADYYKKAMDQGLSEGEATKYANLSAAANSALELFIPVDKVVKSSNLLKIFDMSVEDFVRAGLHNKGTLRIPALKQYLGSQLESFVGENFEEWTQNLADHYIQQHYNSEKLTNFVLENPSGDLLGTAASVGLTNVLMSGLGIPHMHKHWSQKNSEKAAYEHLSRNFDEYLEYSNKLQKDGTLLPSQYKEQYTKVADAHTLVNLGEPKEFFKRLQKLQDAKHITEAQALDLKLNYSKFISTVNSFTKEQKEEYKKLDGIKEKTDYVNTLAYKDVKPEDLANMTNQIYFEDILRNVQEIHADSQIDTDPKKQMVNNMVLSHLLTNNKLGIEALLGIDNILDERVDPQTKEKRTFFKIEEILTKTNAHLAKQTELKDKSLVVDGTPIVGKPIEEEVTKKPDEVITPIEHVKSLFTDKDTLDDFIDNHKPKELDEKFGLIPGEKGYEEKKEEYIQALVDVQKEFSLPKIEVPLPVQKQETEEGSGLTPEEEEDQLRLLAQEEGGKKEGTPKEKIVETPEEDYEYFQEVHLPGNGDRKTLIGKSKKGKYVKTTVNPSTKKVVHTPLTEDELNKLKNVTLVPHQNIVDKIKGPKNRFKARDLIKRGLALFSTNYRVNKNSSEGLKDSEALKSFLASASAKELKEAIRVFSDNKVAEMNKEFLGDDIENPTLSVEDLIKYGFIFASTDKMEHLNKGGRVAAIRRNTYKDVYFEITLPGGRTIVQEVEYPNSYVILEKGTDGKLKIKKLDFSKLSLDEFKSLFAHSTHSGVLGQDELDLQIKKQKESKAFYDKVSTTPTNLSSMSGVSMFFNTSSIANRNLSEVPPLTSSIASFPKIFNNSGKGIVVIFNDWKGDISNISNNKEVETLISTPYSVGYFIQVFNEKTGGYEYIKIYPDIAGEATKGKVKSIIEEYNKITFTGVTKRERENDLNAAKDLAQKAVSELNNLMFIQGEDGVKIAFDSKIPKGTNSIKPELQIVVSQKFMQNGVAAFKELKRVGLKDGMTTDLTSLATVIGNGVTIESFKEQLSSPVKKVEISDKELSDKFSLSTAPYVWEMTASIEFEESIVEVIKEKLPKKNERPSTQNEHEVDDEGQGGESDFFFNDEGDFSEGVSGIQEYDLEGNVLNQSSQDKPDNSTIEADIEKRRQEELNQKTDAGYSTIALDYLFTGGRDVIQSTDYLIQALVGGFTNAATEINNIRNKYADKLGNIKDDINSDVYNQMMNEIRDVINKNYNDSKANEIFDKILKNATGFISREGNQVSSELDKLNEQNESKINAKYDAELKALESKDIPLQNEKESKPIAELKEDRTPEVLNIEKEIAEAESELAGEIDLVKRSFLQAKIKNLQKRLAPKIDEKKTLKLDDGKNSKKLSKEELLKIREELPASVRIHFQNALDRLASGELPLGYLLGNTIYLSNNSRKGTAFHEQFHAVFRLLLTDEEIDKYLRLAKANAVSQNKNYFSAANIKTFITKRGYDITSEEAIDLMAEEWMADDYMDHRNNKAKQSKYSLKALYNTFKSFYRAITGNKSLVDLYNSISNKGYSNSKIQNNRFKNLTTPIYSILRGYRDVIGGDIKSKKLITLITAKTIEVLDKARENGDKTELHSYRRCVINTLIEDILQTEVKQTQLVVENNKTTGKLNEEDLNNLETELSQVIEVLSDEDDINTIIKEVSLQLNKIKYIEGEDAIYEEIEVELGARSFDKSGDEVDTGYGKLSMELKNFFQSIYFKDVDNYDREIERTVDGYKMYNFILGLVSNVGIDNIFEQLDNMSQDNIEVRAVMKAFKEKTKWERDTASLFRLYDTQTVWIGATTNLKGYSFYNQFVSAIERIKTDHKTTVLDSEKGTRIFASNRDTPENFLYAEWESAFRGITFTSPVKKHIDLELLKLQNLDLYQAEVTEDEVESQVNADKVTENLLRLKTILSKIGINLTLSYLHYSLTNTAEAIPNIPKLDVEFIKNVRASFNNKALFVAETTENKGLTSTNRIKDAAKGNAYFDNTVYQTSFKTADGKTRYSYVLPNYIATKSKSLRDKLGISQLLGEKEVLTDNTRKKLEEIRKYKENEYFKNNPLFSLFSENAIGRHFANLTQGIDGDLRNNDDKESPGIVYKDGDLKSLLIVLLNGFAKFDNTKKNGGVNIFKGWTQQMESASTLYTVGLPVVKNLYSKGGGWSEQTLDALYGMFEQEMERINGKFYVDSKNNIFTEPGIGLRNLREVCRNPKFANFKFLNEFKYKVNGKEQSLLTEVEDGGYSIGEVTPEIKKQILEEIKKYFNSELSTFVGTLTETGIVESDPKGNLSSKLVDFKDKEAKYRDFESLNDLIGNFFINDFLMSAGFNQLMYGDLAISESDKDATKRYKGVNAYGVSFSGMRINVAHTTPNKVAHPEFGKDVEINVNDAQGEITLDFAFRKMYRRGGITSDKQVEIWRKLSDGIKDPLEWEQFQNTHGIDAIDLIKNTKSVTYDEQVYLKLSESVLFKNFTSHWDEESGEWLPTKGKEKMHNKRVYMETNKIDLLVPTSASKRVIPSKLIDHNFFEKGNFDSNKVHTEEESFTLDGKDYRLQVETSSHGWDQIAFASQLYQICQSELPEKYDGVKNKLNEVLNALKTQGALEAFNQLSKETTVDGKTSRDIGIWLKNVREGILSTTPDVVLEEMLKTSPTGDIEYDFNLPQIVEKMASYFLGGFTKANAPKQTGRSLILRSPDGYEIITDETGKIVPELEYLKTKNKSKFGSRKLKVHTFEDGKPSWGEIVTTRGWADRNGLKVGDTIPDELLKGLGIRIPTQTHHSIIFFKIVDFLPECMGDTVIAPEEIVLLSGADFDVDKLFTLLKAFYKDAAGKIKIYGKGVITPEERHKEFLYWYKHNDTYVKTRLSELVTNSYEFRLYQDSVLKLEDAMEAEYKNSDSLNSHLKELYESRKTETKSYKKRKKELEEELSPLIETRKSLLSQNKDDDTFEVPPNLNNQIRRLFEEIDATKSGLATFLKTTNDKIKAITETLEDEKVKAQENVDKLKVEKEVITAKMGELKEVFYQEIFKEKPPLYTLADFEAHPELKSPLALNNELLDTMIELLTAPELAESYKTPATMDVINGVGGDIFSKLKGRSYDASLGNSINGKLEAYENNMQGKKLVGPHAMSNVIGVYLEKNRVKLKKGKGVYLDDYLYNRLSREEEDYKEADITLNIQEIIKSFTEEITPSQIKKWFTRFFNRRGNDTTSSYTSAATDNPTHLGMKTLNHTMDTAGAWAMAAKLGMGQVRINLLSASPIMEQLIKKFASKNTYVNPTKESTKKIIEKFISQYIVSNKIEGVGKGLTSTDLVKAYVYEAKKSSLTSAQKTELATINLKILDTFVRLKNISNDAIKVGSVISTNKKIESNFKTFDQILESYDYLTDDQSVFEDIEKTLYSDPALTASIKNLREAINLSPKFFISKSSLVKKKISLLLNSLLPYTTTKMVATITELLSNRLVMKAIEKDQGKETYEKFGKLVLDGPEGIVSKFSELIKKYPELGKNNMLLNILRPEFVKNGPAKLVTSTNMNFNEFTEKMIDSFKAMVNSTNPEIKDFAIDLVWYLIYKDNLKFQFFSYVKYISPEIFHKIAQITKDLSIGLYQNKSLQDLLGVSEEEFYKEFYELLGRSSKFNGYGNIFKKFKFNSTTNVFSGDYDGDSVELHTLSALKEGKGQFPLIECHSKDGVITIITKNNIKSTDLPEKGRYLFNLERGVRNNFIHSDIIKVTNSEVPSVMIKQSTKVEDGFTISTYRIKRVFNNRFISPISGNIEFYESFIDTSFNTPVGLTSYVDKDGDINSFEDGEYFEREYTEKDMIDSRGQDENGEYFEREDTITSEEKVIPTNFGSFGDDSELEYEDSDDGSEGNGVQGIVEYEDPNVKNISIPEANLLSLSNSTSMPTLSDKEIQEAQKFKDECQ